MDLSLHIVSDNPCKNPSCILPVISEVEVLYKATLGFQCCISHNGPSTVQLARVFLRNLLLELEEMLDELLGTKHTLE